MFWVALSWLALAILLFAVYKVASIQLTIYKLKQQGVEFLPSWLNTFGDARQLIDVISNCPSMHPWMALLSRNFEGALPRFVGFIVFGTPAIFVNDYQMLDELYVKKNQYYSKHSLERQAGEPLLHDHIISMQTEHPLYPAKRKALSQAFFKNKVQNMTRTIKEITLDQIQKYQTRVEKKEDVINLVHFMLELQSRIIVNTLVGKGQADKELPYETADGTESVTLAHFFSKSIEASTKRFEQCPQIVMFPSTAVWEVPAVNGRFVRNSRRMREHIKKIINDRKAGLSKSYHEGQLDLLGIIIEEEIYKNDLDAIIDEIIILFVAGMKTIQISTTNLIQYCAKFPENKERILKETYSVIDGMKDDIVEKLDAEVADSFEFTRDCFYESMRIEAPVPASTTSCFNKDVKMGGVTFNAGQAFIINIANMHHDSSQWQRPSEYLPDRFDQESPLYSTPSGEKRHPMVFNPFLGGKRICLGKTFAEMTVRMTVPLLYYHLDFEFPTKDHGIVKYHFGSSVEPEVPMRFLIKNKVAEQKKH